MTVSVPHEKDGQRCVVVSKKVLTCRKSATHSVGVVDGDEGDEEDRERTRYGPGPYMPVRICAIVISIRPDVTVPGVYRSHTVVGRPSRHHSHHSHLPTFTDGLVPPSVRAMPMCMRTSSFLQCWVPEQSRTSWAFLVQVVSMANEADRSPRS